MERTRTTFIQRLGCFTLASGILVANGDTPDHPYKVISVRNAFDLRPPNPAPETKPPEQPKTDKLKFMGISKIGNVTRAHVAAQDPSGVYYYYDLEEGVTRDGITVLRIDEAKESVKISNGGNEFVLTEKDSFTSPKTPGVPVLPNTPNYRPPGSPGFQKNPTPPTPMPTTTASANNAGPTIVSRNSGMDAPSPTALPGAGYIPAATASPGRLADATAPPGLRSIPARAVRTVPTPQSNLTPEEQIIMMEAQRLKAAHSGIPLPPTPGVPPPELSENQPPTN